MAIPSPDWETIEAVSLTLATYGCFPVKLCRVTDHTHPGEDQPCRTPGKRPWEKRWQQGSREENIPLLDAWKSMGFGVGNVMAGQVVGLDEDIPGGLDKWFAELNEPVPLTLTDVVPVTGKRHFHLLRHPNVQGELAGDFRLEDGTVVGEVARDGARQFVSPGAVWRKDDLYALREWNGVDAVATLSENATRRLLSHPTNGVAYAARPEQEGEWQWDESMGSRHNLLVREGRRLAGSVRDEALLVSVLSDWALRHGLAGRHPETGRIVDDAEVRDAATSALRKFEEDPAPITLLVPKAGEVIPVVVPVSGLFVSQPDYLAANSAVPAYVSPLAAYGTVSLVSGPPKGGKSTLVSNLFRAREQGTVFLWGDPVPAGPMSLVTEEGGYPVVRKTQGLTTLDILDRTAFVTAGLKSLDHLLLALDGWVADKPEPGLVVIDTLAVWGDIKDENDASAATQAITTIRVWAQQSGAAVVLVHHTRKGGGDHGEAIRGSGGIFAAVDQSIELGFTNDSLSDDRGLSIAGRLSFGDSKTLAFDRDTMTYSVTARVPVEKYPTDQFPVDGGGSTGWTNVEAGGVWGMTPQAANKHLKSLADNGVLVARFEQAPGSRAKHLVYHRARPLLDLDGRSVGDQMADIFSKDES